MSCTGLLLLLSSMLILASINITAGQECKVSSGNFTTNSTYGRNRDLIFSSLASNVTANGGFYTVDIGQDPDKVYALGLCRGDYNSSSSDCTSCINSGIQDIMKVCPNQKEALSLGSAGIQPCIVRYANSSFLGRREMDPARGFYNTGNLTFNQSAFDKIWGDLMVRLVDKTSGGSSRLKFGTGEANVTYFSKIYALMQCTPDLSRQDCEYCLRESLAYFQSFAYGKQGGGVSRPSCFLRWDLYPFYTPIADAPSPSPSFPPPLPPPVGEADKGSISSRTVAIIVVSAVVLFILLIVFSYICLRRRNSKKKKKKKNISKRKRI